MIFCPEKPRIGTAAVLTVLMLVTRFAAAEEPKEYGASEAPTFEIKTLEPAVPVTKNLADLPVMAESMAATVDPLSAGHPEGAVPQWKPPLILPPCAESGRTESLPGPTSIIPLLEQFDSIDSLGAGNLSGEADASLAVGPNHIVAVVNRAYEVYDKQGILLAGPISLYSFWYDVPGCGYQDIRNPKVLYDEERDRFVMTADGEQVTLCLACTHHGSPLGTWYLSGYPMLTHPESEFSFPQAGIGRDALYVGANIYSPSAFVESRVYAFDKSSLYLGSPYAPAIQVGLTSTYQTPQPINLHGYRQHTWPMEGPHYFLAGYYPFTNAKDYTLFSFSDPFGTPTVTPEATFDLNAVTGIVTAWPSDAPQSGGGSLRAGEPVSLDFEYRNGYGWAVMNVGCLTSPTTIDDCIQWVQIDLENGTIGPEGAGVYGIQDHWFLYPDLAANHCDDMLVGYTRTGSSMHPSVWYTGRQAGDPAGALQAEAQLKAGEAVYGGYYWGRYSGTTIDPDGTTFWHMGQYSKNVNSNLNWGTWIGNFEASWCQQGLILGRKFNDMNGDGVHGDPGDPGLNGWTIQIYLDDGDGVFDGEDILVDTQVTRHIGGVDGSYESLDLIKGTYHVVEVPQTGWIQTYPSSGVHTEVLDGSGWSPGAVDFGNFELARIEGSKFDDMNGNGTWDPGEPGLPGWIIQLDEDGDGTPDIFAVTGLDGSYSFTDLFLGTYSITEENQDGWIQTLGNPGPVNIDTSGQAVTGIDFGNFRLGTISGLKFHDLNCDGNRDPGDPGLLGWIFHLDGNGDGTPDQSVATDINGVYTFAGLTPGTYTVWEEPQAGWSQTTPDPPPIVIVADGTDVTDVDFGNCETAGITGMKFEDLNHNGVLDPGEPGLPDWTIHLDADGDGVPDRLVITAADGSYRFSGLELGTYVITEQLQAGWTQTTTPPPPILITIPGTLVTDVDFGNFRLGRIHGAKFEDVDHSGTRDPGEPGLFGWVILLDEDGDGTPDTQTATDLNGDYEFTSLAPGTYAVTEEPLSGWTQTTPNPPPVAIAASGDDLHGGDFGNFHTGVIEGAMFEDTNADGIRDPGEPGLPGWTLYLDENGDGVPDRSTVTGAGGHYSFGDLLPGSHAITEQLQAGWIQTTADPAPIDIAVSGTVATDVDFGNFQLGSISGTKFEDLNHNGVRDPGEPGVAGWLMDLDVTGDGIPDRTILTAGDGSYSFSGLTHGLYAVTEQLLNAWIQTTPDPAPTPILSGDAVAGVDFGNFFCEVVCTAEADILGGSNPVTVQFTATAEVDPICTATPVEWSWDFGDGVGTSAEQNPVYTYATPGNHTWTFTVTVNGVSCAASGTVGVNAYDMTFNDDHGRSHCCVNSTTGDWEWTAFDPRVGGFSTGMNPGIIHTQSGVMTIQSTPGMPWSMSIKYWVNLQRASGYFLYRAYRIKSPLADLDTTNGPDVCDVP